MRLLSCLPMSALVAAGLLAFPAADAATYWRNASAGANCHAANGAASDKFTFANNYLTNIGTNDQYVICSLDMDDNAAGSMHANYIAVSAKAGSTSGTLTCIAQEGRFDNGENIISASQTRSRLVFANYSEVLIWPDGLPRLLFDDVLTLNCRVPAGFKLGLIRYRAVD